MRRFRYGMTAGALLSLALMAALLGCGTGKDDDDRPSRSTGGNAPVSVQKKLQPVKGTAYDGVISGKVAWKGKAITPPPEPFMTDPSKQDAEYCKQGASTRPLSRPSGSATTATWATCSCGSSRRRGISSTCPPTT